MRFVLPASADVETVGRLTKVWNVGFGLAADDADWLQRWGRFAEGTLLPDERLYGVRLWSPSTNEIIDSQTLEDFRTLVLDVLTRGATSSIGLLDDNNGEYEPVIHHRVTLTAEEF
jgi:hypothetical protein